MSPFACLLTACVIVGAGASQDRPPSRRETTELVRSFLQLDGKTSDGRQAQREILARLESVPGLRARDVRDWRKTLEKEHRRLRTLEDGNRNFWWPDEERGLYMVGGETRRPRGILIAMHGGGAGSGDAASAHGHYAPAAAELGWVCISPEVLEKTERGWTDSGTEEWVMDLVDAALRTWKVDPAHVYLAGHSMGGYGSWTLGAHHADRCAGLAPSAGAPTPILDRATGKVTDLVEGVIPNLRNVRIAIFQSTDDPRVPPGPNQKGVELLGAAQQRWGGFDFEYWEVGDRGHGFPEGGVVELLRKIEAAVRDPLPERIVWQPAVTWKRQFYWLHWERPALEAIVVADLDREHNTIAIQSNGADLAGLSVLLDERLVDLDKEVVITVDGKETRRELCAARLVDLLDTSVHPDPALGFAARLSVLAGDD